jgi:hypothetical protein
LKYGEIADIDLSFLYVSAMDIITLPYGENCCTTRTRKTSCPSFFCVLIRAPPPSNYSMFCSQDMPSIFFAYSKEQVTCWTPASI